MDGTLTGATAPVTAPQTGPETPAAIDALVDARSKGYNEGYRDGCAEAHRVLRPDETPATGFDLGKFVSFVVTVAAMGVFVWLMASKPVEDNRKAL